MPMHFLTSEEVKLLQTLLDMHRGEIVEHLQENAETPWHLRGVQKGADIYVVKALEEIPAVSTPGACVFEKSPSSPCDFYRMGTEEGCGYTLRKLRMQRHVHNINDVVISAGQYMLAVLTKGGRWVAAVSGAGVPVIRFSTLSIGPFQSQSSVECLSVVGEVLDVSCGGAGVSIGDEVTIYDPNGCWFNLPIEVLIGTKGTAVRMQWSDVLESECLAGTGTGTGTAASESCFWMAQTLCCSEEIYT